MQILRKHHYTTGKLYNKLRVILLSTFIHIVLGRETQTMTDLLMPGMFITAVVIVVAVHFDEVLEKKFEVAG